MADTIEKNDARYDWIRVIAVIFVITLHALDGTLPFVSAPLEGEMLDAFNRTPYAVSYAAAAARAVLFLGNSLFVMLSGALLLGYRDESIGTFYYKRVSKVVIPYIVYFIFYMIVNGRFVPFTIETVIHNLYRILIGDFGTDCPFMWLIYVLMALYITFPFLRYMFKEMSYKTLTVLAALIVVFMGVKTYLPIPADRLPFIVSWEGLAILGYWVTRKESEKYYVPLIVAGAVAFVITCFGVDPAAFDTGYLNAYVHCSPIAVFMALGVFSVIFKADKLFTKQSKVLRSFSKNSFTILLLHWWAMYTVVKSTLHISGAWYEPVSFIATIVLTVLISGAVGCLIDNTVVKLIRGAFDKLVKTFYKRTTKSASGRLSKYASDTLKEKESEVFRKR